MIFHFKTLFTRIFITFPKILIPKSGANINQYFDAIFSVLCSLVLYVYQEICHQLLELPAKWSSQYCKLINVLVPHRMLNLRTKEGPIFDFGLVMWQFLLQKFKCLSIMVHTLTKFIIVPSLINIKGKNIFIGCSSVSCLMFFCDSAPFT